MSEGQEKAVNETQESQPSVSEDANVDYKSLYLEEVQNAKKLRKRAQDAEVTIQDTAKERETQKVKQLKEQEKFQELSENLQKQLDEVMPYKEKWETHETTRRESLLSKLPEEDRESLQTESLKTLEYIVQKLEVSKPVNPQHTPGQSRSVADLPKGNKFETMDKDTMKDNWGAVLDSYKNKRN
ncbi:MAG: hypothetical protein Unbinned2990contig1002_52 [Prokaryotic dsDNA virus sp.]|nr:MAG: hypothetical protein Unbinned2990contig1002_52 [Prokaryotic dsDNA virus sp.]|tara:strand:- start:1262 stop:1813 length:552 start_codon:yes stop_codon:yes gene_type:complete